VNRRALVEQTDGTIPMPVLAARLVSTSPASALLPRNIVAAGSRLLSEGPVAKSISLILTMDMPFSGPIQVEDMPMRRALG
jgi:hypothetical protein